MIRSISCLARTAAVRRSVVATAASSSVSIRSVAPFIAASRPCAALSQQQRTFATSSATNRSRDDLETGSLVTGADAQVVSAESQNIENIAFYRKNIAQAIEQDTTELCSPELAKDITNYVKACKFRLKCDSEGEVTITKTLEKYHMTMQFNTSIDEDLQREMAQLQAQNEAEEEAEEQQNALKQKNASGAASKEDATEDDSASESDEEADQNYHAPFYRFNVDLRLLDKSGNVASSSESSEVSAGESSIGPIRFARFICTATENGGLSVDQICFDESVAQSSPAQRSGDPTQDMATAMAQMSQAEQAAKLTIETEELGEQTLEYLERLLNSLGINDQFAQFVQGYSTLIRDKQLQDKLKVFKQFVQI